MALWALKTITIAITINYNYNYTISHAPCEPPYELVQGRQLLAVDQVKLLDEVDEVLQARVHVGLLPQRHNLGSEILSFRY